MSKEKYPYSFIIIRPLWWRNTNHNSPLRQWNTQYQTSSLYRYQEPYIILNLFQKSTFFLEKIIFFPAYFTFQRTSQLWQTFSFSFYNKFILCYNPFVVAPNLATERGCLRWIFSYHFLFPSEQVQLATIFANGQTVTIATISLRMLYRKKRRNPSSGNYWGFRFVLTHSHIIFQLMPL